MAAASAVLAALLLLMHASIEAVGAELVLTTVCSVTEEVPVGTQVCGLAHLLSRNATGRFQRVNDSTSGLFSVDPGSGQVRVAGRIDREGISRCRGRPTCSLTLQATWRGVDGSEGRRVRMLPISVTIRVLDVNDNAPRFQGGSRLKASLQEHDRSARFQLPRAVDLDAGENGSVEYRLADKFSKFSLVDDPHDRLRGPVLLVVGDINLQTDTEIIRIEVLAEDRGVPRRSSTFTAELTVINTNDLDPTLTPKDPQRELPENTRVNSVVLRMNATDGDKFSHPLSFSIASYDCPTQQHPGASSCFPFAIHPRTGEIRLTAPLDAETQQRYEIYVSVTDNHPPSPRTSVSIVRLLVTDVNDNAPQIQVMGDSPTGLWVQENSPPIATVGYISVKDRDVSNRFIHCNLDDFNGRTDAFSLTRMSGSGHGGAADGSPGSSAGQVLLLLQAVRSLDREQQAVHGLSLTCSDSDGVSSTENFTVSVGDVNDSPPVFPGPERASRLLPPLKENSPPGTVIGRLSASDADEPDNARTLYSVAGNCDHLIGIGELNATVYARVSFDRESNASIRCKIRATDAGNPSLTAQVEVVISIDDENDNAPQFPGNYTFQMSENDIGGRSLGRVEAQDPDAGDNGRLVYSLRSAQPGGLARRRVAFGVSPDGRIFVAGGPGLDRERQAAHHLLVEARDLGQPRRTGLAAVRIDVLDENDNAPRFVFPSAGSGGNTSLNVSVSDRPGATVAKLTAVDDDEGANGAVTFSIDIGSDGGPLCEPGLFRLDPAQGHVTLAGPIGAGRVGSECVLPLAATDGGREPRISRQRLRIRFVSDQRRGAGLGGGGVSGAGSDDANWVGRRGPPEMIIVTVCVLLAFLVLLCLVLLAAYFCYYMQPAAARNSSARVPAAAAAGGNRRKATQPATNDKHWWTAAFS